VQLIVLLDRMGQELEDVHAAAAGTASAADR
jgi:hypothetical protein